MTTDTRSPAIREAALLIIALLAAFLVVNQVHFRCFRVYVVLYACVLDASIALVAVAAAFWFFRRRTTQLTKLEIGLAAAFAYTLALLYAVMGPTVIDRSLSIYIVEKVYQRGGEVAEAAMPAIFIDEYMPEYRLVDVRMTEQLRSKTLTLDNGCLRLTPRGRFLAQFMLFYRREFLPKHRVLGGQETDRLNDPFQGSPQRVDVRCPEQQRLQRASR